MSAPPRDRRPQYGWSRATLFQNVELHEPASGDYISDAVERPNGMYRVTVAGRVEGAASAGTGRFGYYVEGSNTGGVAADEWTVIGETNLNELYVAALATVQVRVLGLSNGAVSGEGFIGEAQIPVDRWKYLRIRTFVEFETVPITFDMTFRMVGISADGQSTDNTSTLSRISGDATEPVTDPIKKPEGVRYMSAQAVVDAMILDAVNDPSGFNLLLQVALNQSAVDAGQWVTLDVLGPVVAAGDTGFFANGQSRLIDLSGFQFYRFTAERDGAAPIVPPDTSSYTIDCVSRFDDADWIDGDQGITLLHENLRKTFCMLVFGVPDLSGAPNVEIKLQLCDMNQVPIRSVRRVGLVLTSDEDGFTDALAGAATFTSATAPATMPYGAGNNVAVVQTKDDGTATIQIDTNGDNPLFVTGWNGWIPEIPSNGFFGPGQILISAERADLT